MSNDLSFIVYFGTLHLTLQIKGGVGGQIGHSAWDEFVLHA